MGGGCRIVATAINLLPSSSCIVLRFACSYYCCCFFCIVVGLLLALLPKLYFRYSKPRCDGSQLKTRHGQARFLLLLLLKLCFHCSKRRCDGSQLRTRHGQARLLLLLLPKLCFPTQSLGAMAINFVYF